MKKEHVKDFYFYKAKREKYSARSVYKLKNIQEKYKVISKGNRVLDLGAAPGSWTEYLIEILGRNGEIIALDERPLSLTAQRKIEKIGLKFRFLQQSVMDELPEDIQNLDAVVSDLAPWTQGPKLVDQMNSLVLVERAHAIATKHLKKGGHFIVKIFQSEEAQKQVKLWEKEFKMAKLYKPPSTHKESKEIYFVGLHYTN